ncbi:MAG TPA: class I SAM-dependent methyltransferase [Ktedonosporobacter sp.]|jgi:23S rRNA (cytosine1962-C5)-methyltransferase|nr:class I SAM-dependent methyltransferase [Ktedonosporobacter sp.]
MDTKSHFTFVFLSPSNWIDYALLDSGAGAKLEQFGPYRFVRPEPQALWLPALPQETWRAADAIFRGGDSEEGGKWQFNRSVEPQWVMHYKTMSFWSKITSFRHLGVFPEQASQWDWLSETIQRANRPVRILNLFGYTGLATLVAAKAGAHVTHVDASKQAVSWARENQMLSGLGDQPIRWIVDDALKYVQREVRRQIHYDGLIIDPPKFGRGPKDEIWKLYDSLPVLLKICRSLLSKQPLFAVLTAYAIRVSALSLQYTLEEMFAGYDGSTISGEMTLIEQSRGRQLSTAIFSRWVSHQS